MRAIVQLTDEKSIGWNNALMALGIESHLWKEQDKPTFDLFHEFSPQLFIINELTESIAKCILKFNPKTYLNVPRLKETSQLTWDLSQRVPIKFFASHTDTAHWEQIGPVKKTLPAFDSVRYTKSTPFDIDLGFVGNYCDEYEFINRATLDLRVKIFGQNWLCPECLGLCLQETENRIYSGPTVAFTPEQTLKGLGCGGFVITQEKVNIFGLNNFETYEQMIEGLKNPKKQKFKIEQHTYIERAKELLNE